MKGERISLILLPIRLGDFFLPLLNRAAAKDSEKAALLKTFLGSVFLLWLLLLLFSSYFQDLYVPVPRGKIYGVQSIPYSRGKST